MASRALPAVIRAEDQLSSVALSLIGRLNAELTERYPEEGATHFRLDAALLALGKGDVPSPPSAARARGSSAR
ncbi:hypothetical protein [Sorangium sp. So ce542]|uniref:hypothetical protein n=1 Tax=Sorangium sp. So ce542 TaxID=3133316 RepID=UPI003F643AE2